MVGPPAQSSAKESLVRIEKNIVSSPFPHASSEIRAKLNGYFRLYSRYYVGSTSDPCARANAHAPRGWTKMVLLYEAWSARIAVDLERELIRWSRQTGHRVECENLAPGGEGIRSVHSTHYIYVLVQ